MARTPNKGPAITTDSLPAEVADHVHGLQEVHSKADAMVMSATDALLAVGRMQGFQFLTTVSDVAFAQNFQIIKKSKGYIGIPFRDRDGKPSTVRDLEEFCRVFLGKSYTRCFELAKNLELLGTDLYEAAEAIGFRARDYRALKALPADEQAIIQQAIQTQDREQVIELLQDMALKHKEERDADKNLAADNAADLDATRQILDEEKAAHQETKLGLQRALKRIKTLSVEEADKELRKEAALVAFEAEVAISGNLREVCNTMLDHAEQHGGTDCRPFLASMVRHIETQLAALRDEFALPDAEGMEEFAFLSADADH